MNREDRIKWLRDSLRASCHELDLLKQDGFGDRRDWVAAFGTLPGDLAGYIRCLEIQTCQNARELMRLESES